MRELFFIKIWTMNKYNISVNMNISATETFFFLRKVCEKERDLLKSFSQNEFQ